MTTKRKRKKNKPKFCPNHGTKLLWENNTYGGLWRCPEEGCTVLQWNSSTSTPADQETRTARHEAHRIFDPLWKSELIERSALYKELASHMGLSVQETHIGHFSIGQCRAVVGFADAFYREKRESTMFKNITGVKLLQLHPCCGNKTFVVPANHRWSVDLWFQDGTKFEGWLEVDDIDLAEVIAKHLLGELKPSYYNSAKSTYHGDCNFETPAPDDTNFVVTGSHSVCTLCRNLRRMEK